MMKRSCLVVAILLATGLPAARDVLAAETVDLSKWIPPNIATIGDDASGRLVKDGHILFTDTANQVGPSVSDPTKRFAGNNLTCQNCHLQAGTQPYAMPLTGIWGQFPQYRAREGALATIEDRINGCMMRSMNGRALPLESSEMKALSSYLRWLSTGIPKGAKLVGAGTLRINEPARVADLGHGAQVFAENCAACHASDGFGQRAQKGAGYQFPPLWGSDSFNNGAGMSRLLTAAAYAMSNMPIGTTFDAPILSVEDAYDVGAYIVNQKRPEMANLDRDFPLRLEKPIDTPYGPYSDGFSLEQHKLGPFGLIRAKVKELAAESKTATRVGDPDNASHQSGELR
jgi:thiosulfate dehydrogenase